MKLIFHRRFLSHFSCWRIGGRKKVSNWPQHNKYVSISLGSLPIGSSLCTLSSTSFAAISPFPCLTFIPHLSIYPSHLICCTICAAVISRAPHVLSFTPLISIPSWFWLTPLSRHGSPAWLFDWLVCIPRWRYHAVKPTVYKKKRLSLCCHTVPSAVTQPQLAQHCFHLRVKVFWKQKCDDLTPLPRTKCTITLNSIKTKASPSQSEEHAVQIEQFKSSTTADYWSEPVITLTPHSAGWWKNEHDGKRFYMLMECGIRFFFPTISSG